MPFWMLVLLIVTLIALCWGNGYGFYRATPANLFTPGLCGFLGFVWLVILIIVFVVGVDGAPAGRLPR